MSEDSEASLSLSLRWYDYVAAVVVAAVYLVLWISVPVDWNPIHSGGKGFLLVFVLTAAAAALFTSVCVSRGGKFRDSPAAWLAIQGLFWNPLLFRAIVGAVAAIGLSPSVPMVVAAVLLLMVGLPTTLLGAVLCRNAWWTVSYVTRALQCCVAIWVPLVPPVFFLHVLMASHLFTWRRYGPLNQAAVVLVTIEQVAAFTWALLYYQSEVAR